MQTSPHQAAIPLWAYLMSSVESTLTIDRRFCGPSASGNGGYTCGRLAAFVDASRAVEVTLRLPPPLDTLMRVRTEEARAILLQGQQVVAEAIPADLELDLPTPPSLSDAQDAEHRYLGHHDHAFPECFVCGPDRSTGDGLRIFTGPVNGGTQVAGSWVPDSGLVNAAGRVADEFIWAAIDCAGSWSPMPRPNAPIVLGRFTVEIMDAPEPEQPCIVTGWPIQIDGRKHEVGSALFTAEGRPLACALATWIELRPAA